MAFGTLDNLIDEREKYKLWTDYELERYEIRHVFGNWYYVFDKLIQSELHGAVPSYRQAVQDVINNRTVEVANNANDKRDIRACN